MARAVGRICALTAPPGAAVGQGEGPRAPDPSTGHRTSPKAAPTRRDSRPAFSVRQADLPGARWAEVIVLPPSRKGEVFEQLGDAAAALDPRSGRRRDPTGHPATGPPERPARRPRAASSLPPSAPTPAAPTPTGSAIWLPASTPSSTLKGHGDIDRRPPGARGRRVPLAPDRQPGSTTRLRRARLERCRAETGASRRPHRRLAGPPASAGACRITHAPLETRREPHRAGV